MTRINLSVDQNQKSTETEKQVRCYSLDKDKTRIIQIIYEDN